MVKKTDFNTKVTEIEAKIRGKNYFEGNDGAQNTLVFETMQKYFKLSNKNQIDEWKSKVLSNQYLNVVGTLGTVVLSKPIKPMRTSNKHLHCL